jgi:hypothetical protein
MGPASEIPADKLTRLHEVLGWLNDYVKEGGFVVGSTFTLADVIIMASYSTIVATEAVDLTKVARSPTLQTPQPRSPFLFLVCRTERLVRKDQGPDPELREGQR